MGPALGFWACPPSPRSLFLRAGKVEARPTSCLFRVLCDHRWSGLGPRGSLRPAVSESFLPARWVWSPRIRRAELENTLLRSAKTRLVRPPRRERGVPCCLPLSPGDVLLGGSSRGWGGGGGDSLPCSPGLGSALFPQGSHFPTGDYPPTKIYFQKNWRVLLFPLLQLNFCDSSKLQVECRRYMPKSLIQQIQFL